MAFPSMKRGEKLISSFMEIAVGQTAQTAIRFLTAASWNLEEAINIFLIHNQPPKNQEEEEPSIRDTLYDPSSTNPTQVEVCPEEIWDSESEGSDFRLSSLFRPPRKLLFKGSFEDAKATSYRKDLWLLVNLQSKIKFASHALNRDLWSNESVSQAIESSFILLQVYDDTTEGKQVSTFYKIESAPPVVLLIDPLNGQEMRSWSGEIDSQSFVEDLIKYIDSGPHEHIPSPTSNKRIKTDQVSHTTDDQDMSDTWKDVIKESSDHTDHIVAPSSDDGFKGLPEHEETCSSSNHSDHIVAPSVRGKF
ncbi:unnamed protein product [Thlaspi arvense]|uniref:UAS domain-containing protein n=1 Tax=Thlaspi arvense TaxID=13288 RepID=A0AAU9T834_THLAR|nr:unnamed protein product [Thlaspi arvense]